MRFLLPFLLAVIVGFVLSGPSHASSQSKMESSPAAIFHVKQGDIFYLSVRGGTGSTGAQGRLRGRTFPFFKTDDPEQFGGLIGVDLADPPSKEDLWVEITHGAGPVERRHYTVKVLPAHFKTQELKVPKDYVDLDEETAKRAEEEQEQILRSLNTVTAQRYWEGPFIMPVEGEITGSFGRKRIINGEPRSPHSGEDIKAPRGTDVHATNEGVVALVGDYFFSGKSIFLDHGLGFYSMYFHLDEVDVVAGQKVQKGEVVGKVGSTGRATGPHLHWGTRIDGARVNPLSMLKIK
jgi:Peptidase family M23